MKPNFVNYFFAHTIPVAAFGGAAILTSIVLWKTAPVLFRGQAPIPSICAIVAAIPLGMVLGYFLLGFPLVFIGRIVNGGPFHEGDWVRILVGPHKNQIARVYDVWTERNQICVDLGKKAKAECSDVFFILKVCREQNPG